MFTCQTVCDGTLTVQVPMNQLHLLVGTAASIFSSEIKFVNYLENALILMTNNGSAYDKWQNIIILQLLISSILINSII